jgi:hypothetical protein
LTGLAGRACGDTTPCACISFGGSRRGPGLAVVPLHQGGVAPPERLVVDASEGRLFQPRYRAVAARMRVGLERPRRTWSHCKNWRSPTGGSLSLPSPRSWSRGALFAQAGQPSRWLDCPWCLPARSDSSRSADSRGGLFGGRRRWTRG